MGVIGIAFITFDLDGTLVDSPFERIVLPRVWQKLEACGVREPRQAMIREQQKRFAQDRRVDAFHWDDLVMTIAREQGVDWTDRLEDLMFGELGE
ncbi:MAG: HAD family hydrolase, partial [Bacilli bacterium]